MADNESEKVKERLKIVEEIIELERILSPSLSEEDIQLRVLHKILKSLIDH
jgi:hypothetical protein